MQIQIGLVNSQNCFILGTFNVEKEPNYKKINLENLDETKLDCLFIDNDQVISDELRQLMTSPRTGFPVRSINPIQFNNKTFENWDYPTAKDSFLQYSDSWVLKNNLILLEEIFPTAAHLRALWPNDRTAFFEELWSIIKYNLGTKKLTIIFNDIKKSVKEQTKNQLIQAKIEGTTSPNPSAAGEFEEEAMKHYQDIITLPFEVISHDLTKGEIVMTVKINKSPVLIFAEVWNISKLQITLLSALIDGLQAPLKK